MIQWLKRKKQLLQNSILVLEFTHQRFEKLKSWKSMFWIDSCLKLKNNTIVDLRKLHALRKLAWYVNLRQVYRRNCEQRECWFVLVIWLQMIKINVCRMKTIQIWKHHAKNLFRKIFWFWEVKTQSQLILLRNPLHEIPRFKTSERKEFSRNLKQRQVEA